MSHMELKDRTAVITGAASGIGRALAIGLAKRGCHLALADLNDDSLVRTALLAAQPGLRITRHHLDVGDAHAVAAFPEQVRAKHPSVDVLINNAGVALGGTFSQVSAEDFEWLFRINFHGTVWMTRAFLPLLQTRPEARIVNLSSVFGLMAPPGQVAYSASKFAVRGFSEALRHELQGTNVGVTVVHPGGVATAIADRARQPSGISKAEVEQQREAARRLLRLSPTRAAETIMRGMERKQARVLVGSDAWLIAWLVRLAPVAYWQLLAPFHKE